MVMGHQTILLVEDEVLIAMDEQTVLEEAGYAVTTVNSGEKAVQQVRNREDIDLILMDINLGTGLDGTEAAEIILSEKDIPLAFLSSHTEPEVVRKTEGITSYGYILKNSGDTVLLASLRMAFRLAAAHNELKQQKEELRQALIHQEDAEERVRSSEERFQTTFAAIPDLISIHDSDFNILYSNWQGFGAVPEAERKLGGKCHRVYRGSDTVCPDCKARQVLKSGKPFQAEVPLPDSRWYDLRVFPLPADRNREPLFVEWVRDVTEKKQTQQALRESEMLWKSYVRSAPYAIFVADERGRYCEANPAAERVTGFSQAELLEKKVPDLIPERALSDANAHFARLLRTGTSDGELPFIRKDGEERRWTVSARRITDRRYIAFCEDVTESRNMELALRDSENRFQHIFRHIENIAVQGYDSGGRTIYWNKASERLYGYSEEEALGRRLLDLIIPDEMKEPVENDIRNMFTTGKPIPAGELTLQKKDGSPVPVYSSHAYVALPGRPPELYCLDVDIADRKKAESGLYRQLEEKDLLLRETHHRIKNNIAAIEALLAIQQTRTDKEEVREALQESVSRLGSIRRLYEMMLLPAAGNTVSVRKYLTELAEAILDIYATQKPIHFAADIEDFTLSQPQLFPLGIMVNELLTNSMKYAFRVSPRGTVSLSASRRGNRISILIADDGPGFPPAVDLHSPTSFGLRLVQMLCSQLGGTIAMEGGPGVRVRLTFDAE